MAQTARTILIADDDRLILSSFQYALAQRGHNVLLAEHGAEAIALLERQDIDIVFLDVLMPRKEGLETLIEIKQRFPSIPVHVMSGGGKHGNQDYLEYAQKFGATGILRKPITHKELLKIVNALPDDVHRSSKEYK